LKFKIDKNAFLKSWSLAEHAAGVSSSVNIFSTVYLIASDNGTELRATDLKTSIRCSVAGVEVVEPGEAVIPIKHVSDLFKKAGSSEFSLEIDDGKALMKSGKSRYRFSTYPATDFPKLPSSSEAKLFCTLKASALSESIDKGALCASSRDEFPVYISSAYFEIKDGALNIVSTDKRRLALYRTEISEAGEPSETTSVLLPYKALRDLQKILGTLESDSDIRILLDDSQAYFVADGVEFSIRKVISSFPDYTRILPTSSTTTATVCSAELLSALERVDIIVRDFNRTVLLNLQTDGDCVLSGRAPEFGEAVENIESKVEGESIRTGFNSRFFGDAVKALSSEFAELLFNGPNSHMVVRNSGSDAFVCMVAPVEMGEEESESVEVRE
jgi:DNA polymerase-3 subunit beta